MTATESLFMFGFLVCIGITIFRFINLMNKNSLVPQSILNISFAVYFISHFIMYVSLLSNLLNLTFIMLYQFSGLFILFQVLFLFFDILFYLNTTVVSKTRGRYVSERSER